MKALLYTILSFNLIATCIMFIIYMVPIIPPSTNPYLPSFGLMYPFFFLIHLAFIIFWSFVKKKYILLSLITLLIGFTSFNRMVSFKSTIHKADTGQSFYVNSWNIASLYLIKKEDRQAFYSHIKENSNRHTIFFFQEVNKTFIEDLKSQVENIHLVYYQGKSSAILSYAPILDKGILNFGKNMNSCVWADVKIRGEVIRFYNAHLQSNTITSIVNKVNTDINDGENWMKVGNMFKKYSAATQVRYQQAKKIKEDITKSPYPVVMGGDMNDVPQSYVYRELNSGMQDGFIERGFGLGATFAGRLPALRIDYIFCDDRLRFLSFDSDQTKFSDHHFVRSRLELIK